MIARTVSSKVRVLVDNRLLFNPCKSAYASCIFLAEQHRLEHILWSSSAKVSSIQDCWATRSVDCSCCGEELHRIKKAKAKKQNSKTDVEFEAGRSNVQMTLSATAKFGIPPLLVLGTHGITPS